ncbi:hypothetical protein GUJ93_ZPchr0010g10984 [Zizania palustris]|uniref:Uncharacterized protein n=1 Tax=Zizania palustris TaxID=103762 RepID=A0A8J6BF39_ZIZPA|nr:hypothetical protein GUJ93_ZPchr0010g10984 [Zizania palustris]
MATTRKGMVTPLGAVFSPEEMRRAVARVVEAAARRRAELARLKGFATNNAVLVSLVLLGEGYYTERSAKQTTEILCRRGIKLETQLKR